MNTDRFAYNLDPDACVVDIQDSVPYRPVYLLQSIEISQRGPKLTLASVTTRVLSRVRVDKIGEIRLVDSKVDGGHFGLLPVRCSVIAPGNMDDFDGVGDRDMRAESCDLREFRNSRPSGDVYHTVVGNHCWVR